MTENRKRPVSLRFRVSEQEYDILKEKMAAVGTNNQEAFCRKMILEGMVVRLDLPEIRELISQIRYLGNNVNQIAKRLNETGRAYETDIADVKGNQKKLIEQATTIINKLSSIR
jgi:hypothetical protein